MIRQFRSAFVLLGLFTVMTGLVYPLAITAVAQLAAPGQANGSLVVRNGKTVGSVLIGQRFSAARYFHGRPSAAGADGYDAGASSGSNLGPTSKKLLDRIALDKAALGMLSISTLPADAVTASASGLDPHISPAFAAIQIARVAEARGIRAERIARVVQEHTQGATFGFLGQPRVNVLVLNLALDAETAGGAN